MKKKALKKMLYYYIYKCQKQVKLIWGREKKSEENLPGLSKDLSGGDMSYILTKVLFAQVCTVMGTYQRYTYASKFYLNYFRVSKYGILLNVIHNTR